MSLYSRCIETWRLNGSCRETLVGWGSPALIPLPLAPSVCQVPFTTRCSSAQASAWCGRPLKRQRRRRRRTGRRVSGAHNYKVWVCGTQLIGCLACLASGSGGMCLPQALQPLPSFPGHACLTRFSSPFASCAGKASKEAGSSSGPESQFIRGVIALHDKYIEYVQAGWLLIVLAKSLARLSAKHNEALNCILGCWLVGMPGGLASLVPVACLHLEAPLICFLCIAGLVWQLLAVPQGAEGRVRVVLQQAGARMLLPASASVCLWH